MKSICQDLCFSFSNISIKPIFEDLCFSFSNRSYLHTYRIREESGSGCPPPTVHLRTDDVAYLRDLSGDFNLV